MLKIYAIYEDKFKVIIHAEYLELKGHNFVLIDHKICLAWYYIDTPIQCTENFLTSKKNKTFSH